MIGEGKKKMCVNKDASQQKTEGNFSCSTCLARSDDKSLLCDPVEDFGEY